jgi:hypothetical protein
MEAVEKEKRTENAIVGVPIYCVICTPIETAHFYGIVSSFPVCIHARLLFCMLRASERRQGS